MMRRNLRSPCAGRPAPWRHLLRCAAAAFLLAFTGCAGGSTASGPGAPPIVRRPAASYTFYDVEGGSAAAVSSSLRERGPRTDGRTVFGYTRWNVSWNARWSGQRTACRVTELDVRLRVEVTLPRWADRDSADGELVRRWDEFIHALSLHEAGHVSLAEDAAREVRSALRRVSAPCPFMQSRMASEADRVVDDYRDRQRRYDERTRRGVEQGAVWPPRPRPEGDAEAGIDR